MREAMARRLEANGGRGLNYGRHFSERARQNMREAALRSAHKIREKRLGMKLSKESIEKRTATRIANNGGLYAPNEPHSKPVVCVETGEKFLSIGALSRSLNISIYYTRKFLETETPYNGRHYVFLNEKDRKDKGEESEWHLSSKKLNESKSESKLVSQVLLDQAKP